ncbi:hypothetical protein [Pyxidicoccus sp. MSG2]|uniref:hypothetical protein n=1 Tax=Pyxidicoccus sp. MSG2 TaxID=2996790 RepID=UPI00226EEAC9|nr:hypothetical protein [Pyxidicoccus sp. MSG2]MCY1023847.1 hypothetical protein [Pyxidicoccus sp. MSG2]
MNGHLLKTMARLEMRLRMRRLSSLVALLAVVALSWMMIPAPTGGETLMAVGEARVRYTSSALALGSASLGGLLFGLVGFFLLRGRIGEDLRTGTGGVIAATPVGNGQFLFARWLGGVASLGALVVAFMTATMVLDLLRGEGPLQPLIYLYTFGLLLLPTVFFAASCAVLFDSWAPLMGKRGDILFFILWVALLSLSSQLDASAPEGVGIQVLDFLGVAAGMARLQAILHTSQVSLGMASFDASLPPITLPDLLWTRSALLARTGSAVLALLPLLPATVLFHRFSPDRVKDRQSRKRRSPLEVINGRLRSLTKLVRPMFRLASLLPGSSGQMVAEVALTLTVSPSSIAALLLSLAASLVLPADKLAAVLSAAVAFWAILVSEVSTRDHQSGTPLLTGAVQGGIPMRYVRQLAATFVLGLLFMGAIAVRWASADPVRACAVVVGTFSLSALASLLGRCTNTPRTFLALFLFGFYVALNATQVPMLDMVGFNGVATAGSVLGTLAFGLTVMVAGAVRNEPRGFGPIGRWLSMRA